MREGKGERDRRGGRRNSRKGGQEPALPIKNRPAPLSENGSFFKYRILAKIPTFH